MKNKIFTISIVFILISFLLISNVFAYGEAFTYNDSEYNMFVPDAAYNTFINLEYYNNPNYKWFATCGNSCLYVRFFPADLDLKIWSDGSGTFYSNSDTLSDFSCYFYLIRESDGVIIEEQHNSTNFATSTKKDGYYISGRNHYFYTNMNVYTDSTCTSFFFKSSNDLTEDSGNLETPDYDAWYDSIFSGISDWVGSLLEMLVNPFGAIAEGIKTLGGHFSGVLNYLNPFHQNFMLKDLFSWLNPASEDFILLKLWNFLTDIVSYLNPLSDNFILKQLWEFLTNIISYLNPLSDNFILKQLWEFLTNIISYLNPFSEDFFAYQLINILLDGLNGLFVPKYNYFSDYFNELNNWFSERLGFLYYPLELLFDLLDRMLNINFKDPIINIPDIKEPTTNITLIKATSFNFNSLLDNSVFSNVHNIYLLIVDAGIYIGLVALLMKKYEEVMTK